MSADYILGAPRDLADIVKAARLIVLVHAAETAGLAPVRVRQVHTLAYFSNVLSPVWRLAPLDGKILKRNGGPFYPALQAELDRLVGRGLLTIHDLDHVLDEDGNWRLEGSYRSNPQFIGPVLDALMRFRDEQTTITFIQELVYAFVALATSDIDASASQDATYSDPVVTVGNVVDFGEWRQQNYSARVAAYFESLLPSGKRTTSGEKLHVYVRHLHQRLEGAR